MGSLNGSMVMVGDEHIGPSGIIWTCIHEGCVCSPTIPPADCHEHFPNVFEVDIHFRMSHMTCAGNSTKYFLRCKNCWAQFSAFPPHELPNGGFCGCIPGRRSLWQLLAGVSQPMSDATRPESLPVPGLDFWDDTVSSAGTYTSYNDTSSNLGNGYSSGTFGAFEPSGGYMCPKLELASPNHVHHDNTGLHMIEHGENITTRLLLYLRYWKHTSQRLQSDAIALLRALLQHTTELRCKPPPKTRDEADDQYGDPDMGSCRTQVVPGAASHRLLDSTKSRWTFVVRSIWLTAVAAILLAPLLLCLLPGLRTKWVSVEARLSHILTC